MANSTPDIGKIANELLQQFQGVLGLSHWKITITVVDEKTVLKGNYEQTCIDVEAREADIQLSDKLGSLRIIQQTLCHALAHIINEQFCREIPIEDTFVLDRINERLARDTGWILFRLMFEFPNGEKGTITR
jgi:hypothetical protein